MLKGPAKTAYQREYMRKRRAGQPTRKPSSDQPSQSVLCQVEYWAGKPLYKLRGFGRRLMEDLDLKTDADVEEAMRRTMAYRKEQRLARKKAKEEAAVPPEPRPPRCTFCYEPETAVRPLVGNGVTFICATCIDTLAALVAEKRGDDGNASSESDCGQQ